MIKNFLNIFSRSAIYIIQFLSHPQRNLILLIISGVILAPISYVVSKETAEKYYAKINERERIQVSEKVQQYAGAFLPETSPSEQTSPGSSASSITKPKSSSTPSPSSSSSSNGSSDTSNQSNSSNGGSSNSNANSDSNSNSLPSCGSNYTFFNSSPIDLADFTGLVPLGNVNPSGHVFPTDHIYFYFSNNIQYPLYAPGNLTISQISASQNLTQGTSDYSITFQSCQEFKAYFLHVTAISSKLSNEFAAPFGWDSTYTTGGNTYRNYGKNVGISVSGGEQIGNVGGNPGQASFDMGAYDSRVTLNFANPSRWSQRSDTIHTVCPINYYSGDLKNTLMGRFGDYDGDPKRTQEPVCGTIEQDATNTAQGVWFKKGTNTWQGEDEHLALIHNNVYPNKALFSVGTSLNASNLHVGYYEFFPQSSGLVNRDFDDVIADNNVYCYEMDGQGWVEGNITVLLQLPTSTTLKIERGSASSCGSGPWSFTASASEFER